MSFLKRLAFRGGTPEPEAEPTTDPSQLPASLSWFLDGMEGRPSPMVLDLGVGAQRQFMNLVTLGYRVTADDTAVGRLQEVSVGGEDEAFEVAKDPGRWFTMDLPSDEFDGVLAWNSFDSLSYLGGFLLAQEISRVLKVQGLVMGTWGAPDSRHRQSRLDQKGHTLVAGKGVHPLRFLGTDPGRYEVGDILSLFRGFNLCHSMVLANGSRRILLEKTLATPALPFPSERPRAQSEPTETE